MDSATKAQNDASFRAFATKVTEFSRSTIYDFADGSFLVVWASGRTEVNTITA